MEEPPASTLSSFPTDPSAFDSDERISFSKLDNKFIAVSDDGNEFEFDAQLKRWIPTIDEELIRQQQQAYGGGDDLDTETEPQQQQQQRRNNKKRKKDNNNNNGAEDGPQSKKRQQQPRQNTAVYVTGLPPDATLDEVHDVFSRKCGVVAEEIDSGRPRIKMYTDAQGRFKGDALVVFFKPQSVDMALMLLDDTDFRYSVSGLASGRMRVQAADSSYKKTNNSNNNNQGEEGGSGGGSGGNGESGNGNGNGNAADKAKSNRAREQDKQKIIKRTQKLAAKLADWDDDDPYAAAQQESTTRKDKVVVLRHMFTLQELSEDPAALLDIKEDIREECEKLGPVTNVVLYDLEEEGVVSVKFKTYEAAEACVELMDGRAFDGRKVRASIATGRERYKKSGKEQDREAGKNTEGEDGSAAAA